MTDRTAARETRRPELPPAFSLVRIAGGTGAFEQACRLAGQEGAGTFVWSPGEEVLDLAVILEPDEPLRTARRAFFIGMTAILDALGSVAPPEKPLSVDWPGTIRFDGARLGGGRLAWPDACAEDHIPDWLVFSAALIASKDRAGEPGLTPGSTSLDEEGFGPEERDRLAEAFARHLLRGFVLWREDGFEAAAASYLARLSGDGRTMIDRSGHVRSAGDSPSGLAFVPALREPAWLDPGTGRPRL
ncbi:biotin/lipoate--protein ligase family protein [uncultured Enterovirga sp.]|uniref:biotin/lipoate--protein ligase family protein n=1 Tax=uncultured Enterovirga sp. TaxID=2026352 RepID=UPI0035C9B111